MNFLVINFPWYQYTPFFWLLGANFIEIQTFLPQV